MELLENAEGSCRFGIAACSRVPTYTKELHFWRLFLIAVAETQGYAVYPVAVDNHEIVIGGGLGVEAWFAGFVA